MNIETVISPKNLRELFDSFAKINSGKAYKGFNGSNYFVSLSNRFKIRFYLANENHQWQREGNSTSLSFQPETCANLSKIIEWWTSELINIGVRSVGLSKMAKFRSEQRMLDPKGNQFLILLPYLTTGSDMKALI